MLREAQQARYLKSYAKIEAGLRIEGMDTSGDPLYESAKNPFRQGS